MTTFNHALAGPATLRLNISQGTQSISGNYSIDSWSLQLLCSNGASWNAEPTSYSVNINGSVYSGTFTFDFRSTGTKTIRSGSTQVNHTANGTKTISISGSIGGTGTVIGSGTVSGSYAQTTIPRASTPSFAAGAVIIGDAHTINTNRASSGFTHTLTYTFGSASGTIGTGVGASVSWTPPLSLLDQIPSATTGVGNLKCVTFSGSTNVGTKTVAFTLTADTDVIPTFTSISCTEHNSSISTSVGAFVQSNSQLDVAIVGASGVHSSTITSYKITVDSQTINAVSGTTGLVNSSGTIPVTATVTDSRGRTFSDNISISVLPYSPPTITSVNVQRTDSGGAPIDEGTYATMTLNASVQSLIPVSTEKNALSYRISSKAHTDSSYTVDKTVTPGGISFNSTDIVSPFDIDDSFDFLIEVIDLFATSAVGTTIPTGVIFMHWDGSDGIGILKYRENGAVDVEGDIYASGDLGGALARLNEEGGILVTDCNDALANGWYSVGSSADNLPSEVSTSSACMLEVQSRYSGGSVSIRQTLKRNGIDQKFTNFVLNPSAETGTTANWLTGSSNTTIAISTAQAFIGTHSIAATTVVAGSGAVYAAAGNTGVNAKPETEYWGSLYVRSSATGASATANLRFLDSRGATITTFTGTSTAVTNTGWTRLSITNFSPADTAKMVLYMGYTGAATSQVIYVDAAMIVAGNGTDFDNVTPLAYFDGDTTDSDPYTYAWTGTANASNSTKTSLEAPFDIREWVRLSTNGGADWSDWIRQPHGAVRFKGALNNLALTISVNVPWNVVEDTSGAWNVSTSVWTAPYTGLYLFSIQIKGDITAGTPSFNITRNGNLERLTPGFNTNGNGASSVFFEYLDVGETISTQCRATGFSIQSEPAGSYSSWFEVVLIN